ncbi:DUF2268 domain-containing putative Zn-dependent protease [Chitinophaga jiangningensis]|nr:DUF2268 domain-containing putative Zn-dependent protease [Chitinophaga jiangningensis]
MRKILFVIVLLLAGNASVTAQLKYNVVTSDIPLFWQMYDHLQQITDSAARVKLVETEYLSKGSPGLHQFATMREMTAAGFVKSFRKYPLFWQHIREKTLAVQQQLPEVYAILDRYEKIYPSWHRPDVYFTIGYLGTGGTTTQKELLIGTEIAAADSTINSEGMQPMLRNYFRNNRGIAHLVAHEITHTQQKGVDKEGGWHTNLLGYCLAEGICDFVAELLLEKELETPYIHYGKLHEAAVWQQFQQEMAGNDVSNWLYNNGKKGEQADLGYFVGYAISKSYYLHTKNKTKALQALIGIDVEDIHSLNKILKQSRYHGDFFK